MTCSHVTAALSALVLASVAVPAAVGLGSEPAGPLPPGGPGSDASRFATGSTCNVRGLLHPLGCQAWSQTWQPQDHGRDNAVRGRALIQGANQLVLGGSIGEDDATGDPGDSVVAVFNASDGSRAWTHVLRDQPVYVGEVGASEELVFLTGNLDHEVNGSVSEDEVVYAFNAQTGEQVWRSLYTPGDGATETGELVTTARDGSVVVVAGIDFEGANDLLTVAYNASTGEVLWSDTYDGPRGGYEMPCSRCMAVSPDGRTAYVGVWPGESTGPVVVAYNVTIGDRVFVAMPESPGTFDNAAAMALSPDGSTIVISGDEGPVSSSTMTVAFDARTGEQRWQRIWESNSLTQAVEIAPSHGLVIVAGLDIAPGEGSFVLAYDLETGERVWRSDSPLRVRDGGVVDLDVGPTGDTVVLSSASIGVPGGSDTILTGISLEDGAPVWSARYDASPGFSTDPVAGVHVFEGLDMAVVGGLQQTPTLDWAWMVVGFEVPPDSAQPLPGG